MLAPAAARATRVWIPGLEPAPSPPSPLRSLHGRGRRRSRFDTDVTSLFYPPTLPSQGGCGSRSRIHSRTRSSGQPRDSRLVLASVQEACVFGSPGDGLVGSCAVFFSSFIFLISAALVGFVVFVVESGFRSLRALFFSVFLVRFLASIAVASYAWNSRACVQPLFQGLEFVVFRTRWDVDGVGAAIPCTGGTHVSPASTSVFFSSFR